MICQKRKLNAEIADLKTIGHMDILTQGVMAYQIVKNIKLSVPTNP